MGQSLSKDHYYLTLAYVDSAAYSSPDSPPPPKPTLLDLRSPSSLNVDTSRRFGPIPPNPRPSQDRKDSGFDDSYNVVQDDAKALAYIDATYYSDLFATATTTTTATATTTDDDAERDADLLSEDQFNEADGEKDDKERDGDVLLINSKSRRRPSSPPAAGVLLDGDHVMDANVNDKDFDLMWGRIRLGDIADLRQIDLTGRLVRRLSNNIRYIIPLHTLILADNYLKYLPPTIDALVNLTILDLSHNAFSNFPLKICSFPKLTELNLSHNLLSRLPPQIGSLSKLATLILDNNQLTDLPQEIGGLKSLTALDVSHNPLHFFPAELSRLPLLRRLRSESCPMLPEFHHDLRHNPPSMLETCARLIVREKIPLPSDLRPDLRAYLASSKACSYCGGPFFRSYIRRGRVVQRAEDVYLPLIYTLCKQHWNDEVERVRIMFTAAPTPQMSVSTPVKSVSSSSSPSTDTTTTPAESQIPANERRRSSVFSNRSKSLSKGVNRLSSMFFPSRLSNTDETATVATTVAAFAASAASSLTLPMSVGEAASAGKFGEAEEVRIGRWVTGEPGIAEGV